MKKIVFLLAVSILSLNAYTFESSELVWFAEENEDYVGLYSANVRDIETLYSTGNLKITHKYVLVDGVVNEYKEYLRDRDTMLNNLQKKIKGEKMENITIKKFILLGDIK